MTMCKRMVVTAVGIDKDGEMQIAKNSNLFQCTGEEGNCGCIHAEVNLLKKMPNPEIVISTHSPCLQCAALLKNAGVKKVIYFEKYRKPEGIEFLKKNNIEVIQKNIID